MSFTCSIDPGELAVVIPTLGRWEVLARTLEGLSKQTVTGFETLVVVDGPGDEPPGLPALRGLRVLRTPHGGPGAARNAGVAATTRRLVLFLGDDMIPVPELVGRHLETHRGHQEGPVVVIGLAEWHPEVAEGRCERWLERSSSQFDYGSIAGDRAGFGHFYSCNASLDRLRFLEAGGFDSSFTYYYEDLDLGYRLHQKGTEFVYEPLARAEHLHRYDLAGLERRFRGIGVGEHQMATTHPWFTPFFLARIREALSAPPAAPWWPRVEEALPRSVPRLRRVAERQVDRFYHQHLASHFLEGWWAAEDLAELRSYLGERYDHRKLVCHRDAVDEERRAAAGEDEFYRTSESYLYDLTAFAMSGTKAPYLAELRSVVPAGARVLDYGCGIGADGLRLAVDGYDVTFADFSNPSTAFLRWRLDRRGISSAVLDVEHDEIPCGFDAAYSFDVIEHVEDPYEFLARLESVAGLVMVNLLDEEEGDTDLHHPLPVAGLLDHADRRGIVRYRRYHGRSHLVVYRSPKPPDPGAGRRPPHFSARRRLRSIAQRRAGAYLSRRAPWHPVPSP